MTQREHPCQSRFLFGDQGWGFWVKAVAPSPEPRAPNRSSERGSILLLVVWTVTLLSLFAVSVASHASFALGLTERLSDRLRASYVARGAAQYAAAALEADDSAPDGFVEAWSDSPGWFLDHPLGGGTFRIRAEEPWPNGQPRYGLTDEDRYLNLNTAPREVLRRLFQLAGGLREEEASGLAAAVEDWRDEDDTAVSGGAEGSYYRGLENAYDCKDGPFESVEELRLVRGVSPELYRRLEPHLTVYGSGRLNVNTAGRTALLALGLSELGADGVVFYRAGEDNVEGTGDDRRLSSAAALASEWAPYVPAEDLARLTPAINAGVLGVTSGAFRLLIEAWSERSSSPLRVFCIMDRDGTIRRWNEL